MKTQTTSPAPAVHASNSPEAAYQPDARPASETQAALLAAISQSPRVALQAKMADAIGAAATSYPTGPAWEVAIVPQSIPTEVAGDAVQCMGVQIVTDPGDASLIGEINIVGRPASPYSGTMGDHSTAFITHVETIRRYLVGTTFEDAVAHMDQLANEMLNLEGINLVGNLGGEAQDRFNSQVTNLTQLLQDAAGIAGDAFAAFAHLQRIIGAYLETRELVPLSTINTAAKSSGTAGKGKGEAGFVEALGAYQDLGLSQDDLQAAIFGLFDASGVASMAVETNHDQTAIMAPGIDPSLDSETRMAQVWTQHLQTIQIGFPEAFADSGLDINDPLPEALVTHLQSQALQDYNFILDQTQAQLDIAQKAVDNLDHRLINSISVDEGSGEILGPERFLELKAEFDHAIQICLGNHAWLDSFFSGNSSNGGDLLASIQGQTEKIDARWKFQLGASETDPDAGTGRRSRSQPGPEPIENFKAEIPKAPQYALSKSPSKTSKKGAATQSVQLFIDQEVITDINFGGRPKSPFSNTMGAHTTAWVVHQDHIRAKLCDQTVSDALAIMRNELVSYAFDFLQDQRAIKMEQRQVNMLQIAKADVRDKLSIDPDTLAPTAAVSFLQEFIADLLQLINLIPDVTRWSIDVRGKNEGNHRAVLLDHETSLSGSQEELSTAIEGLFDAPGGKRDHMWKRHLQLIEATYPQSYADAYRRSS